MLLAGQNQTIWSFFGASSFPNVSPRFTGEQCPAQVGRMGTMGTLPSRQGRETVETVETRGKLSYLSKLSDLHASGL